MGRRPADQAGDPSIARGSMRGRSIARGTARAIILCCCIATLVASGLTYALVGSRAEERALRSLKADVAQRVRVESQIFDAAAANLAVFRDHYLAAYTDPRAFAGMRFEDYYGPTPDGAIRMHRRHFDGVRAADGTLRQGNSAFIGATRPPMTDDFRRRLVIAAELVARFGPAWTTQFANLHATFPENALVQHWPGEPWGLEAEADLDMTAGSVVRSTMQSHNPARTPVWSGLYYDLTAKKWSVTYQLPVDHDGRHLVTPSHDIVLDGLVRRLADEDAEGSRHLIIAGNGDLVAQPERMDQMLSTRGVLNAATLGDPVLREVHAIVGQAGAATGPRIVRSDAIDSHVAIMRIPGPDWWYVALYPQSRIAALAWESAGYIFALGLAVTLLVALIVAALMRSRVAMPLAAITRAADHVARGDYRPVADGTIPLPEAQRDEIGLLSRVLRNMAGQVHGQKQLLEETVAERTSDLRDLLKERDDLHERYSLATGYVTILDGPDHRVRFVNPAAQRLLGGKVETGRPLADQMPELVDQGYIAMLDGVYRSGDPLVGRAMPVSVPNDAGVDAETRYVDNVYQPIRNADGDIVGIFTEGHDVTDAKHAQEKVLALQSELIHVSRLSAMGAMAATLAHELNQPLAAIANYASGTRRIAADDPGSPLVPEGIDAICDNALRAGEVIRRLREMIQRGETRTEHAEIAHLVREATSLATMGLADCHVEVMGVPAGLVIEADPIQMQQVLLNLIRNACEAGEGDPAHRVEIEARRDGARIEIAVCDNGPGIAPQALASLFEPFYSTKPDGMGVGLSISRTIVEAHGGTIHAHNRDTAGACFRVRLPSA